MLLIEQKHERIATQQAMPRSSEAGIHQSPKLRTDKSKNILLLTKLPERNFVVL